MRLITIYISKSESSFLVIHRYKIFLQFTCLNFNFSEYYLLKKITRCTPKIDQKPSSNNHSPSPDYGYTRTQERAKSIPSHTARALTLERDPRRGGGGKKRKASSEGRARELSKRAARLGEGTRGASKGKGGRIIWCTTQQSEGSLYTPKAREFTSSATFGGRAHSRVGDDDGRAGPPAGFFSAPLASSSQEPHFRPS